FIMAGSGDMELRIIEKAAELGISHNIFFTGFLRGDEVDKAYQMADVFVMPSVSEPFGIAPLESLTNSTPVIISKQSGISEILKNCLVVDFWDIDEMTNKIMALLKYRSLNETLVEEGFAEVRNFKWQDAAKKCIDIYKMTGAT
ncbi:MAG: glycosyltransferase, partial [Nanoarchaeota archaeon]